MILDQTDILRIRFWSSQTGLTFAQVTLKDINSNDIVTHHLNAARSGLLYDGIKDLLTKPSED